MKKYYLAFVIFGSLALNLTSCKKDDDKDQYAATKQAIKDNYAAIVSANYEDTYTLGETLKTKVEAFTAAPSAGGLTEVKNAWLAMREAYGQTEAFRFADGPIDNADGPEGRINAWPLDENYIDYVAGSPSSGIINDVVQYPTVTKELLDSLNEKIDEKSISLGFHAIEFLLWGQDLTAPADKKPGERPYTDFVDGGTASNQSRRREYLKVATDILLEDLASVKDQWSATGSYRNTFLKMNNNEALTHILTGIGTLSKSELAGERIFTAYNNQNQEDEHSCFSDNTHRDIRLNALGVKNVYTGFYKRTNGQEIKGASLSELLTTVDPTLAAAVTSQLNTALADLDATIIPFDYAISTGVSDPKVLESVNALRTLGDKFSEAAKKLGLTISTELPG
jgi:putative iron-regulated protein